MFCLAPWVSVAVCALLALGAEMATNGPRLLGWVLPLPVWALAAARLANLGNDLTYAYCRTPRIDLGVEPEEDFADQKESGEPKKE
jgi:hypothetical protein